MSTPSSETVYCAACQSPNTPDAQFCRYCGRDLDPDRYAKPTILEDPEPEPRRRRWPLIIGAVLLVALVGLGVFLATRGDDTPPKTIAKPPPPARPAAPSLNTPTGVIRRHWNAIADGSYSTAYALFSHQYKAKTAKGNWVATHEAFAPKIHIESIRRVKSLPGDAALVFADIYSRDTGKRGDGSACVHFVGKVRVAQQDGRWRYDADGRGDTFVNKGAVQKSDAGCKPLFA